MWVIGGWLGWVIHGNWKIIYKGKIRLMFIGVLDGGYFGHVCPLKMLKK